MDLLTLEMFIGNYADNLNPEEIAKKGTEKEPEYRINLIKLLQKERSSYSTDNPSLSVIDEMIAVNIAYANILTGGNIPWISRMTGMEDKKVLDIIEKYEREHHKKIAARVYPERAKLAFSRS